MKKIGKAVIYFFAFMAIFTVVSRVFYNMRVAKVETTKPYDGNIYVHLENKVLVKGKEKKIMTSVPGVLIENCFVDVDAMVREGEPLYSINEKSLQTIMTQKTNELTVIQSQIQEAESQKSDTIKSNALNYDHAVENYNTAVDNKDLVLSGIQNEIDRMYAEKDSGQQEFDDLKAKYNKNPSDELRLEMENKLNELNTLSQSIDTKTAEYDQTRASQDLSIQTARQQMEQAASSKSVSGESTIVQAKLAEEQLKTELEELKQYESDMVIKAPCDLIVDEINIQTGQATSSIADLTYFEMNHSCEAVTTFITENFLYMSQGAFVEIVGENEKDSFPITSTRMLEENLGIEITVDLENSQFKVGDPVTIIFESEPKKYDCILPREALHYESEDRYSVYVLENKKTILGDELTVKKQEVTVLDKNETQVAVNGIGSETEVITSYNKSLSEGDTVQRYEE